MTLASASPLTLSPAWIALGFAAIAYLVAQVRDYRPMRTLRQENKDLRDDLDKAKKRISDLEKDRDGWKARTDLTVLQQEHREITNALERITGTLDRLDRDVKANTAAVEVIARGAVIRDVLDEHDAPPHARAI